MEHRQKAVAILRGTPSLKARQVPVTENRMLYLRKKTLDGGRQIAAAKSNGQLLLKDTSKGSMRAHERAMHASLVQSYRSMKAYCVQLWRRQNKLYIQLLTLHKMKRTACLPTKLTEKERMRQELQQPQNDLTSEIVFAVDGPAHQLTVTTAAETIRAEANGEVLQPFAKSEAGDEQACEVQQPVAKSKEGASKLPDIYTKQPTVNECGIDLTDDANFHDKVHHLPKSVELPPLAECDKLSTSLVLNKTQEPIVKNLKKSPYRLTDNGEGKRQILIENEKFNIYNLKSSGKFEIQKSFPYSFSPESIANSKKEAHKRERLLNSEMVKFQSLLQQSRDFDPKLPHIDVRELRNPQPNQTPSVSLPEKLLLEKVKLSGQHLLPSPWIPS